MSDSTPPSTMRAWTFNSPGAPRNVLSLNPVYPVPPPPTGTNLLIRISHASLNPNGYTLSRTSSIVFRRTTIPEIDFSGRVQLAGPAAPSIFAPGTPVFGTLDPFESALRTGAGTLAEYVVASPEQVTVKPANLSFAEAAGLGASGQTALKMFQQAGIKSGHRVLVNGASGGIGTLVVQAAKARGAEVVATSSGLNAEMVKGLGADQVVDYRANAPLHVYLAKEYSQQPFDVILDTIGIQALFVNSPAYLKPEGLHVNVGAYEGHLRTLLLWSMNVWLPKLLGGIPRKYIMFSTPPNKERLELLAKMVEEGKLKGVVDGPFEMEDALNAYDRLWSKRAKGKLVVKIGDL